MKNLKTLILTLVLLTSASFANAALIKFNATGVAGISGFVEFDDSFLGGTSSEVLIDNLAISNLQLDVFGELFTFADAVTTASTVFDLSGLFPVIINGAGNLADNGALAIAFFPDGFGGTAPDGDASLSTGPSGDLADAEFFAVKWEIDTAEVSAPASVFLLGTSILLILLRLRKS